MAKAKHWLCIAAVTLALVPVAWADDSPSVAGFFEELLARIVEQVVGPADADPSEIGILVPVGGANATGDPGPGNQSELGIAIPVGG